MDSNIKNIILLGSLKKADYAHHTIARENALAERGFNVHSFSDLAQIENARPQLPPIDAIVTQWCLKAGEDGLHIEKLRDYRDYKPVAIVAYAPSPVNENLVIERGATALVTVPIFAKDAPIFAGRVAAVINACCRNHAYRPAPRGKGSVDRYYKKTPG